MKIISKDKFNEFVNKLIGDELIDVEGVKAKGDKFVFGPISSAEELRLDYDTTIIPPKKYFLPQYETLMKFDLENPLKLEKFKDPKLKVIIGVHPYDLIAIKQMDSYYLDTNISDIYLKRRKNTLIIVSDVVNVSDKAFFGCMGTGNVTTDYDLYITDLGHKVAVEIGTIAGKNLLDKASEIQDATPVIVQKVRAIREAASKGAMRGLKVGPKGWYDLLETNYTSEVWKIQSDKCLSCGTCTLVCPTCFCYDVIDNVDLNNIGERIRTWDSCLLRQFTEVASGEIFRKDIIQRYRHRFQRKGRYLPEQLGFIACVGCGRCSLQCIPDIADPVNVINMIFDASEEIICEKPMDSSSIKNEINEVKLNKDQRSLHEPLPATLRRVEKLTKNDTLFEIELDNGKPLGHIPGQFIEVSIMGIGEAPLSISSPPGRNTFEIVVRKMGDVTSKLHSLKSGDKIGIRGPFGKGFNIDELKGKHLLFIGGGIGIIPMRSLINYVIDNKHRKEYGAIHILYGCKEPCELLFNDEIALWDKRKDINHLRSVDSCPEGECWDGEIGLITKLIPRLKFNPRNTIAIIIGPPVMYRYCIQILLDMGLPEENILVSLERRMKCGVGKCGHCQINDLYVCKDGPVFNFRDIKDLPEAFT